jgi:superfamily II DNA or RNA helicase
MLRDYQKKAIEAIEKTDGDCCLQMPTGSGKTFTFCELAKRHFTENVEKVLIVVHRTELLNQAYKSLGERCFKIEKGVKNIPHDYDYYVAMVETLNRRINLLPEVGLVIIDECHIGNFRKLPFFENVKTKVVGVTATPVSEKPLKPFFKKLIQPIELPELINQKYLLNCDVYGFASDAVDKAKFKISKGEFDEKQMEDFYSSEKLVKTVIDAYWQKAPGKKTMIFNVNVKHNQIVYDALKAENLPVYQITGETSDIDRKKIIELFKMNPHAIMCSVGVLTTGFDEPSVEVIILNRATKSISLYFQMIGRGARICKNKEKFIVLDLGKNTTRHGFYDDYIDWNKFFEKGSKKEGSGGGVAPIKECPECGFIQHTRKVICEGCGHDFEEEKAKQEKEEKEQKLFLLIKERPINIPSDRIYEIAKERNWKEYAVLYKIAEHIHNYQTKYSSIVPDEYADSLMIEELKKWCEKYNKKFNKWHIDYVLNILKQKRDESGGSNTSGNI